VCYFVMHRHMLDAVSRLHPCQGGVRCTPAAMSWLDSTLRLGALHNSRRKITDQISGVTYFDAIARGVSAHVHQQLLAARAAAVHGMLRLTSLVILDSPFGEDATSRTVCCSPPADTLCDSVERHVCLPQQQGQGCMQGCIHLTARGCAHLQLVPAKQCITWCNQPRRPLCVRLRKSNKCNGEAWRARGAACCAEEA
jgi:hypothetical protein